jgi:hypothetical protein
MRFGLVQKLGTIAALAMVLGAHAQMRAQGPMGTASASNAFSIPGSQQLQPEELNRLLETKGANKPLMLQVGSHLLFAEAHIAGSEYVGPGSQAAGLDLLKNRVAQLSHKTFIVLYCGCYPWNRCPNMGPAFKLLHDLGFTNVKALYLANNLGTDWVDKGYPIERGR